MAVSYIDNNIGHKYNLKESIPKIPVPVVLNFLSYSLNVADVLKNCFHATQFHVKS